MQSLIFARGIDDGPVPYHRGLHRYGFKVFDNVNHIMLPAKNVSGLSIITIYYILSEPRHVNDWCTTRLKSETDSFCYIYK